MTRRDWIVSLVAGVLVGGVLGAATLVGLIITARGDGR